MCVTTGCAAFLIALGAGVSACGNQTPTPTPFVRPSATSECERAWVGMADGPALNVQSDVEEVRPVFEACTWLQYRAALDRLRGPGEGRASEEGFIGGFCQALRPGGNLVGTPLCDTVFDGYYLQQP